jgi:hypothetical protein
MATHTLSTGISRRSMLLGGALIPSLGLPLNALLKLVPAPTQPPAASGADAELFHRIAVAERLRNDHARVRRLRDRLRATRDAAGQLYTPSFRLSQPDLWRRHWDSFERYATAVRAAVAAPAHTIAGVHAKLALATIASRRGGARVYMYEDREWLEIALADLRRIAENSAVSEDPVVAMPTRSRLASI